LLNGVLASELSLSSDSQQMELRYHHSCFSQIKRMKKISQKLSDSLPKGWCGSISASGWMTHDTFLEYLKNHLYPLLSDKGTKFPVVLIVDNASSHISIETSGIYKIIGLLRK